MNWRRLGAIRCDGQAVVGQPTLDPSTLLRVSGPSQGEGITLTKLRNSGLAGAEEFEFYEEAGAGQGSDPPQLPGGGFDFHVLEAVGPNLEYGGVVSRHVDIHGVSSLDAYDVI